MSSEINVETIIHTPSCENAQKILDLFADGGVDEHGKPTYSVVDTSGSCDRRLPMTGFWEFSNGKILLTFRMGTRVVNTETGEQITLPRETFFSIEYGTYNFAMSTVEMHLSTNVETGDFAVAVQGVPSPAHALPFDTTEEFFFQMCCAENFRDLVYDDVFLFREASMRLKKYITD